MSALSRRAWLNLALLGLVAVLAALAFFEPGIEPVAESPGLTDRSPDSITRVRIERPDQPAVGLERRDGQWRVIEPLALPANAFRVQTLLEVLDAKSERRLELEGLDLSRFGLDPPRGTIVLDELRLDFGDTESLSGQRYVRVGDALHLTTDRFFHQLVGGAPSFVHLNPLGPDPDPVAIELPDRSLRMVDGRWQVEPEDSGVSADAVNRLVDAWRTTQAITVRALDPTGTEGRPVAVTLNGQPSPIRFTVVETPNALVLVRPEAGVQYQLPADAAGRLFRLATPASPAGEPLAGDVETGVVDPSGQEADDEAPEEGGEGFVGGPEPPEPPAAPESAAEGASAPR